MAVHFYTRTPTEINREYYSFMTGYFCEFSDQMYKLC